MAWLIACAAGAQAQADLTILPARKDSLRIMAGHWEHEAELAIFPRGEKPGDFQCRLNERGYAIWQPAMDAKLQQLLSGPSR